MISPNSQDKIEGKGCNFKMEYQFNDRVSFESLLYTAKRYVSISFQATNLSYPVGPL
jgi:hypothetical protein